MPVLLEHDSRLAGKRQEEPRDQNALLGVEVPGEPRVERVPELPDFAAVGRIERHEKLSEQFFELRVVSEELRADDGRRRRGVGHGVGQGPRNIDAGVCRGRYEGPVIARHEHRTRVPRAGRAIRAPARHVCAA